MWRRSIKEIEEEKELSEDGILFVCELLKLLSHLMCRYSLTGDMHPISDENREGAPGAHFDHMFISAYESAAPLLVRYGICLPIGDAPNTAIHEVCLGLDDIVPANILVQAPKTSDLVEILTYLKDVFAQCEWHDVPHFPIWRKVALWEAGIRAGYLEFVRANETEQQALNNFVAVVDGGKVRGVYFWTSKLVGSPIDEEVENELANINFWELIHGSPLEIMMQTINDRDAWDRRLGSENDAREFFNGAVWQLGYRRSAKHRRFRGIKSYFRHRSRSSARGS